MSNDGRTWQLQPLSAPDYEPPDSGQPLLEPDRLLFGGSRDGVAYIAVVALP